MGILAWVLLGLIAGAIARLISPENQEGGILATGLLGILGAFTGDALHTLLTNAHLHLAGATFSLGGIILAAIGAVICISIWGLVTQKT